VPQKKTLTLTFPAKGIDRRWSNENQPNGTTPDALNVRPTDAIGERERGGSRPGLVRAFSTQLPGPVYMMQTLRFIADEQNKSRLFASAGGSLYMENDYGDWMPFASSPAISRFNNVMAVEFQGKLYIANTGRSTSGDWVSPIVSGGYVPRTGETCPDGGTRVCFRAGSSDRSGSAEVTARLALDGAPLIVDPVAATLTAMTASVGTAPADCSIVAVHAGRLVLAGSASDPQQWFMSKVLTPLDWDYSADDPAGAVSGTTAEAGKINGPITALAPTTDLCMIFSTRTSLHILRGDPKTGQMDVLSHEIGIIDKRAWCHTADGAMVFLSADGVYVMPAMCGVSRPDSVSREKLPSELLDIDPTVYTVNLEYDVRARGVHIFVSANDTELESQHWFLDWETKGFFRMTLATDHHPFSSCYRRDITSTQSLVYLGCADGYVRRFYDTAEDDDGETFSSYVMLGPITPGDASNNGVVSAITGRVPNSSGNVKWSLHIGDSAEEAYGAPASRSGIFTPRKKIWAYPKLRCSSFFIKVQPQTVGEEWAIEQIDLELQGSECGGCNKGA
jgi:hypothetical protein